MGSGDLQRPSRQGFSFWIPRLSPGTIEHSPQRSPWCHLQSLKESNLVKKQAELFFAWHTLVWFTLLSAYSVQTSYFSLDSSCVFPGMFLSRSWGCSCFYPMATMSTRIRGGHESIRMWTNMLTQLGIYDFGNMSSKLSCSEQLRNLHRNSEIFKAPLN